MYIMTYHNTFLATNRDSGDLIQVASLASRPEEHHLVDLDETDIVSLQERAIKDGAREIEITQGSLTGFAYVHSMDNKTFSLKKNNYFACAEPNSRLLVCNRVEPSMWETFSFVTHEAALQITRELFDINRFHKYHLGCGRVMIRGFLNIDLNSELLPNRIYNNYQGVIGADFFNYDLRKGLPGKDGTLEIIYHCHFLEHLTYTKAIELLQDSYLRLKSGGIMRIVVPDLELWIRNYTCNNISFFDAYRRQVLQDDFNLYGTNAAVFMGMLHNHGHRWGYDYATLHWLLEKNGFRKIRRLLFQESNISEINEMEPYSPLRGMESLCIECTKVVSYGDTEQC